jgi:hypothetical protein
MRSAGGALRPDLRARNTLFLLETRALQSRCLSNVREMLSESGVFVVEAYDPSPGVVDGADDERLMSYKHEVRTAHGIRQYAGPTMIPNRE